MKNLFSAGLALARRYELFIFLLLAALNTAPLFVREFYPFMDGPAHLYNAHVIHDMLLSGDTFLSEYFRFNPVVVPNWFSHVLMSPLFGIFPPSQVEKAFLVAYFFFFAVAFRYCISAFRGNKLVSYLGLPLAYQNLILFSFYNFSSGLVLMLFALGFFYKRFILREPVLRDYLGLFALVTAVYFCHLVVLMILLLLIAFFYLWKIFSGTGGWKQLFSLQTLKLVLVPLPALALLAVYMLRFHTEAGVYTYLEDLQLLQMIAHGSYFIGYCPPEAYRAGFLLLVFVSLFAIAFYQYTGKFKEQRRSALSAGLVLGILSVLALFIYLPDGDGKGGFVSIRMCILLFILIALFISTAEFRHAFLIALLCIVLYHQYKRINLYKQIIKDRSEVVSAIRQQASLVEPNSFLFSYKLDDDWLSGHYYNYLCIDKPVVALQDYEAYNRYFPLIFRDQAMINDISNSLNSFQNLEMVRAKLKNRPVYLWVSGDSAHWEERSPGLKKQLEEHALLLNSNNFASLYKLK